MNGLDLVVAVLALAAAVGGYRIGFLVRALSWLAMAAGLALATVALPWMLNRLGDALGRDDLLLLSIAVVAVGGLAGQGLGYLAGSRLHLAIAPAARRVDAVMGAVAGVAGVAVLVWLLAPAMADVPEWPARQARGSAVVGAVTEVLPRPPDASRSVRRVLGGRYPQVFDAFGRAPEVGPPPPSSGLDAATAARVGDSTVEVVGEACNQVQAGSGFVVAADLVVTNAHVVAGEATSEVRTSDGRQVEGQVVAFDPERDLALLSVPGIDRPPLPLADASVGDRGAVFGHPGGGPLRLAPFTVGQSVTAVGADIYDRGRARRQVLVLAADLAPGDSGSALVSPQGQVIGMAFAIAPDRPGVAYALSTSELRSLLARPHQRPVAAGSCVA